MRNRLLSAWGVGAAAIMLAGFAAPATAMEADAGVTDRADHREQVAQFVQCLRDNGVELPEHVKGESRGDRSAAIRGVIEDAMAQCGTLLPERPAFGEGPREEHREAMRDYAQCLTDQGLELEVPAAREGNPERGQRGRLGADQPLDADQRLERVAARLGQDPADPAWIAANEECELPAPAGPRGMHRFQQD